MAGNRFSALQSRDNSPVRDEHSLPSSAIDMSTSVDKAEARPSSRISSDLIIAKNIAQIPPFRQKEGATSGTGVTGTLPSTGRSARSIAVDPPCCPDVRRKLETGHTSISLNDSDPAFSSRTTGKERAASVTGHKRNVSSTSDFAYPPSNTARHGIIKDTDSLKREHERTGKLNHDFSFLPANMSQRSTAGNTNLATRSLERSDSFQTTAVNTTRNSSIEDLAQETCNLSLSDWAQLRSIIELVKPGVHISINFYTPEPPLRDSLSAEEQVANVPWTKNRDHTAGPNGRHKLVYFSNDRHLSTRDAASEHAEAMKYFVSPRKSTWKQFLSYQARANLAPWVKFASGAFAIVKEIGRCAIALAMVCTFGSFVFLVFYTISYALDFLFPNFFPSEATGNIENGTCLTPGLTVFLNDSTCPLTPPRRKWATWVKVVSSILALVFVVGGGVIWLVILAENRAKRERQLRTKEQLENMDRQDERTKILSEEASRKEVELHMGIKMENPCMQKGKGKAPSDRSATQEGEPSKMAKVEDGRGEMPEEREVRSSRDKPDLVYAAELADREGASQNDLMALLAQE